MCKSVWVVTSEVNDYNQHGSYLEHVFFTKPTVEDLMNALPINGECAIHILTVGGRKNLENTWYYLTEYIND